ncbi:uncharacterized protein ELE39_003671 [Cryptosporidium sp. chipmunk genotype I]|uniref:uncharacterized protein n=1 Tax=Cryptosporidium sp. chipmunk genotype I TaxID=1280935 RepID=UPI00351A4D68|nr:hypothetical protein ELE39_003671 [Cryptosporidium sp. chipmunk genotype I]
MVREAPNKSNPSPNLAPPNSSTTKTVPTPIPGPAPTPTPTPGPGVTKDSAPINIPIVSVSANERSGTPNSKEVIQVPSIPKEEGNIKGQTSSPPVMSSSPQKPSSQQSSPQQTPSSQPTPPPQPTSPPQKSSPQQSSSQSVPASQQSSTAPSKPAQAQTNPPKPDTQKMGSQKVEVGKFGEMPKQVELNGIGSNLDSRRSVENTKFSLIESELDSKFPDIKTAFSKDGLQEVRVALIFIVISLIMVIGFSIRKYRKLRKGGEQVRNITNTVFPVKIVSLYLYIFLSFPITVLMQFFSCIAPMGYGMFNVIQSIYQSSCYIWLWDLFVEYFGGSEQIVTAIRRTGPYQVWKVPPFMIPTSTETYFQPKIVIVSYILMIQFLPINILVSILNVIHPSKAFLYNIILIISLSISTYGIMLIYWPSKEALQPYQGGWKFGILVIQSFSIIVVDSIIRLAKYENREYNSIVYKLYWKLMLTCGVATICTLAAVAIIDSREIYQIYNLSIPTKNSENIPENKAMLAT